MIFPFEITRQYKLPDSEFGDYSSSEIIERIYKYLLSEEFESIKKENNEIELVGNNDKMKNHINWFKTDRVTHCIDKGIVKIIDVENKRKLTYSYQIKGLILGTLIEIIIIPIIFTVLFWSLSEGLIFFWFILIFEIFYKTYLLLAHSATVSAPIEIMRFETIRKNINKKDYGC